MLKVNLCRCKACCKSHILSMKDSHVLSALMWNNIESGSMPKRLDGLREVLALLCRDMGLMDVAVAVYGSLVYKTAAFQEDAVGQGDFGRLSNACVYQASTPHVVLWLMMPLTVEHGSCMDVSLLHGGRLRSTSRHRQMRIACCSRKRVDGLHTEHLL